MVGAKGFVGNRGGIRDYQNLNHERSLQKVILWLAQKVFPEMVVESEIIKISTIKNSCGSHI